MTPENTILIGIDIGGTNVRAGAVSPQGDLLFREDALIEAARGPDYGLPVIIDLVDTVIAQAGQPVLALGIGSTGPLDREHGCIQNPYTLPGWENVDIVSPLRQRFGVPVALENDADAAALGEAWVGAGRGFGSMVMVTIGTGVGFALIKDGVIHRGIGGEHPEGGHILIDPSGPACYCGANGCLESLVAGPAIAAFAREAVKSHPESFLARIPDTPEKLEAKHVFDGARQGDSICIGLVDQTADYIVRGLISILMMILPDAVVLTGGVLRSFDLMEERIRAALEHVNVIIPAGKVHIQLSKTGQQAGLFGAARAAQLLQEKEA
ncbi:MAG: ROK family protein [Anaerolineales bacterium]|nr:ROK family protein [Anaerolineales bacterium]